MAASPDWALRTMTAAISICLEGRYGGDSLWTILSLKIFRTVEQTIKLKTIVMSIYELAMVF